MSTQEEKINAAIARALKDAPPLSEAQIRRLRGILNPGSSVLPLPALNQVTPPEPVKERTALYRHFDKEGVLLYVGISFDPNKRRKSHARHSAFMQFAVSETVEWLESREEAMEAERAAIKDENPLFNSVMSSEDRDQVLTKYLIKHEAWHLLRPTS